MIINGNRLNHLGLLARQRYSRGVFTTVDKSFHEEHVRAKIHYERTLKLDRPLSFNNPLQRVVLFRASN